MRGILRTAGVLVLVVLAAPLGWRLVSGDTFMAVTGTSMEPTYHVGDVLLVQRPTGRELNQVGQVVVVSFSADPSAWYVHRVDEVVDGGAWLRGDNNDTRDPRPVTSEQVVGTPRLALTGATAQAFTFTQSLVGRVVLATAALILLLAGPRTTRPGRHAATPSDSTTHERETVHA